MVNLLIVEDNRALRDQLKWGLKDDYHVLESDSLESTMKAMADKEIHLLCLDLGLENKADRGLDIIDAVKLAYATTKIIVMTSNRNENMGSEAVLRGAFDYLQKPVNLDELKVVLARAERLRRLETLPASPAESGLPGDSDFLMIGRSAPMLAIFQTIRKLAPTDVSVLITGESGTGKELCARALHYHSARRNEAFVPINCGSIPETLIESELFGYVKGAFTGASADKRGLIASAEGGTLFLDEIGEMPLGLQVKLLRFLQDRHLQPLGGTELYKVDVRVIAATNRPDLGREGVSPLRSDLYYRLSEFEIRLPSLREREEDVLHIARHVLDVTRVRFRQSRLRLSPRAEKALTRHDWPGNVRELCNKLNRAAILCVDQVIEPADLDLGEPNPGMAMGGFKEARLEFERRYLLQALRQAQGNISTAARRMGLSRPAVYDLMKKLGISLETETRLKEGPSFSEDEAGSV